MSADAATAVAAAAAAASSEPAVEVPDRPMLLRELGLLMHKMAGVNPQVRVRLSAPRDSHVPRAPDAARCPGRMKWPCWPLPLASFAPSASPAADPQTPRRRTKAATDRTNARSSASPVSVKASTLNGNLQQPRLRGAGRPGPVARRARAQRNRSRRRRSACCCNISTTINTCRLRCATRHPPTVQVHGFVFKTNAKHVI